MYVTIRTTVLMHLPIYLWTVLMYKPVNLWSVR